MLTDPYVPPPDSVIRFLDECVGKMATLPATQQRQAYRLVMRLRNGSQKALRLARMFDRGEISGDQLLELAY